MQGHHSADSKTLLYLQRELNLSVPAVKDYHVSRNHVFLLASKDLTASHVISRMLSGFKKTFPPREVKSRERNLCLVLRSLTCLLSDILKLSPDKHLTQKMYFLLAFTLVKRISELHGLSFCVQYSQDWKSCTFSSILNFMAKTQNTSVHDPRFEEFMIPSLDGLMDVDRNILLLCPIRSLKKDLSWVEQCCLDVSNLLISASKRKKGVSQDTIWLWI